MAKGFMIFLDGADLPRYLHESYESATKEAWRLSRKFPNRRVLLLEFHKEFNARTEIKRKKANKEPTDAE